MLSVVKHTGNDWLLLIVDRILLNIYDYLLHQLTLLETEMNEKITDRREKALGWDEFDVK